MERSCPLCGEDMEEHEVDPERLEKVTASHPDAEDVKAFVCTECGHVSYRLSASDGS